MFSDDIYSGGLDEPDAAHLNAKGYHKIGEVIVEFLISH